MSKTYRERLPVLWTPTSGNLRLNSTLLRYPLALPLRTCPTSYSLVTRDGEFVVRVEGELTTTKIPSIRDQQILHAFHEVAFKNSHGRIIGSFESGQALYSAAGLGTFEPVDVKRVKQAIRNWKKVTYEFDGLYYVKGKKRPVWMIFGVLDSGWGKKQDDGQWKFRVRFNDDYMKLHLDEENAQRAYLHHPTYKKLKSDFARSLFSYLSGQLAWQGETLPLVISRLKDQLGVKDSPTLRNEWTFIRRVKKAVNEINMELFLGGGNYYVVRVTRERGERRLIFNKFTPDDMKKLEAGQDGHGTHAEQDDPI